MRSKYNLRPIRQRSFLHFFVNRREPQILLQQQQLAEPPHVITRRATVNLPRLINIEQHRSHQQQQQLAKPPHVITRRATVNLPRLINILQHRSHQQAQPHSIKARRTTVSAGRPIAINQQQPQPPPIKTRRVTVNVPRRFVDISHNIYSTKAYETLQPTTKHEFNNRVECDVVVKRTKSSGEGLLANQIIRPNKFIGELVGQVFTNDEQHHRVVSGITSGRYSITRNHHLVLDTEHMGNNKRKVNNSCRPNSVFKSVLVNGLPTIRLYALKQINKDEEITVSYGKSYAGFGLTCGCGVEGCKGVIGG